MMPLPQPLPEDAKEEEGGKSDVGEMGGAQIRAYLERYGESLKRYAQDASIAMEVIDPKRAGKDQPESFAIDLEKGTIYADASWFADHKYTPADIDFALSHEVEHFRELRELLHEPNGYQIWQDHRSRIKRDRKLFVLDDVLDNIRIDRTVIQRRPSKQMIGKKLRQKIEPKDLTKYPKHLQFVQAIEHEALTGERCTVNADVRTEIETIENKQSSSGRSVIDVLGDPHLPSSKRLELQRRFFEPIYEKLFREDIEEHKKKSKGEGNQNDSGGAPEEPFREAYEEILSRSPQPFRKGDMEKIVKEYVQKEGLDKSEAERAEEAYAREHGVTVEDLRAYRRFFEEEVMNIKDPESSETVLEELRAIFRKIVSERSRPMRLPHMPVTEGEVLINPAQAYADIVAGREETESWMTFRRRERPGEKVGTFDVILVCDGSQSMDKDPKKRAQRLCAVLFVEALQECIEELDGAAPLMEDLSIRTELRIFGKGENGHEILKPLSADLTETQRVTLAKALQNTFKGSTPDFLSLEDVLTTTPLEDWEQVNRGERKKIVIVLTDGDSDDNARMEQAKAALREKGAIVVVLGVTHAGPTVDKKVETVEQLGSVFGEILKGALKDL